MKKEYIKISKFLSYILRHHPEKVGITLDQEGFTDLDKILEILNQRYINLNFGKITEETIKDIIEQSDKLRFEISGGKIRAFYGHSIDVKIIMKEPEELPQKLYHGTNSRAWMFIKEEGLKKKGRQYVHLSDSIHTAKIVARRRTSEPIILEVDTTVAKKEGIKFYKSGDMYLAEWIPPKFIFKLNS